MSPDLLYWIRDVHYVFLYFKWSLPLSIELVCFSHLVSAVECSVALNLQFERPYVKCPYHMHLSADAELLADFNSHHNITGSRSLTNSEYILDGI